jgi:MFS family permease
MALFDNRSDVTGPILTLLGASALASLPSAAIAPALPAIQNYFVALPGTLGESWIPFILSLPSIAIIFASAPAGYISDHWGRKPLLLASLLLFALAGGSGLVLHNLPLLLLTRILLGFAVAGSMTPLIALVGDYFSGGDRAKVLGWQSGTVALAGVGVSLVSGVLADWNWRASFALYLLPLFLVPFVLIYLPEPQRIPDLTDSESLQANSQTPPFPWGILLVIYGIEMAHMIGFFLTPLQLPFHLQQNLHLPARFTGLAIGFMSFTQALSAFGYNRIREKLRLNIWEVVALAFGIASLGHSLVATAPNYISLILGLSTIGLGFGLLFPNSKLWITTQVPEVYRGRALGGLVAAIDVGVFISPFLSQNTVATIGVPLTYEVFSIGLLLVGVATLVPIYANRSQISAGSVASNPSAESNQW